MDILLSTPIHSAFYLSNFLAVSPAASAMLLPYFPACLLSLPVMRVSLAYL
jgi:hypothetical protein